jgi:hypothetical protein
MILMSIDAYEHVNMLTYKNIEVITFKDDLHHDCNLISPDSGEP